MGLGCEEVSETWYPVGTLDVLTTTTLLQSDLNSIRDAGLEVCRPRKECDVHRGQPEACYLCL
jgi:hypothetical protein